MVNLKNIEYDLRPLRRTLEKIRSFDYTAVSDNALRVEMDALRRRAVGGEDDGTLLPEAFALAAEAVKRALGLTPHDNQLMAAAALARGDIIELATGEGKTLVAVFTATLKALGGKGVHVLTFNDYLARRDAEWMGPVYSLLGLSVGSIAEGMAPDRRKDAYTADVTYITAKEAGFDYLRGFLAFSPEEIVQRPFHFAIIDEADSILIDEARIPLVIAGDEPSRVDIGEKLFAAVSGMERGRHFETDDNDSNIFLEDAGIDYAEKALGLGSLYDEQNLELLAKINLVLQAQHLLERDVDYIVRDGEILLVDAFTGRVALGRQWSDGLHAAVELKEGVTPKRQGKILNKITLQSLLRRYPGFCGMTGTACPAASEFMSFYGRSVTVIPPDKPCIRADRQDVIFTHGEAKYRAVAREVLEAHRSGRPVLVGTASVEESERLADILRGDIPGLCVLNAKNDAEEAAIIADAGKPSAVTISTNMAGRGVDIRLGGQNSIESEKVRALGGLYILGTNRHESVRVDNQLRGRAGRQGDPGESRFFISLEDSLARKFGLTERLSDKLSDTHQDEPLRNDAFRKAVLRTQRYTEAESLDAKITLFKYAQLVEDQRMLVHQKRMDILTGRASLSLLEKERPEKYGALLEQVSEDEFVRAQKQIELYALGQCWAEHLLYVESLGDEIFLRGKVRGDPLMNYHKRLIEGFEQLQENVRRAVLDIFDTVVVTNGRIDLERMGIKGPTSTRTYLVHDGTEGIDLFGAVGELAYGADGWARLLYILALVIQKIKKKSRHTFRAGQRGGL
jgi:preprotein translocase subunit SecA